MDTVTGVHEVHSGSVEEAVILVYSESKYLSVDGCHSAFIQLLSELDYHKSPPGY